MNLFLKLSNILRKIYKNYKIHFFVWILFIAYELLILMMIGRLGKSGLTYFMYYLQYVSLFYINAYFFNRSLTERLISLRVLYIFSLVVIEIVCFVLINFFTEKFLAEMYNPGVPGPSLSNTTALTTTAWRMLYFIGFSVGYVYIIKSMKESKRTEELRRANLENTIYNQRLENELVKVENDFLRSQINPHFLFNTLSFIYNGTRKTAPDAASAILSLSDMMRYALKQPGSSDTAYLRDEIEQVENLINLHKLRAKNASFIALIVKGDMTGVKFLPLVLLTLIENVFKHGNLTQEASPAVITINYDGTDLFISTENLIAERSKGESNSVGMENIRKRLYGYYKDRATFEFYKKEPNTYYTAINVREASE